MSYCASRVTQIRWSRHGSRRRPGRTGPGLVDLSGLRRELDAAILPAGFIDYEMAFGYARGIDSALDRVEELRKTKGSRTLRSKRPNTP